MTRAIYEVRPEIGGYAVWHAERPYGPYETVLDAVKTAAHAAADARKTNPSGSEVIIAERPSAKTVWRSEDDGYPMDFRARLGLPPLI